MKWILGTFLSLAFAALACNSMVVATMQTPQAQLRRDMLELEINLKEATARPRAAHVCVEVQR